MSMKTMLEFRADIIKLNEKIEDLRTMIEYTQKMFYNHVSKHHKKDKNAEEKDK